MTGLARIETARLVGTRITPHSLGEMCVLHEDPEVMATLNGIRSTAETQQMVERFDRHWDEHGFGLWMLHDRATGAFVGRGGLQTTEAPGKRCVEVGYALMPPAWGRGLATEIGAESLRLAFDALGLEEVWGFTMTTNTASRRVLEKLGLRFHHQGPYANLDHVFLRIRRDERAAG